MILLSLVVFLSGSVISLSAAEVLKGNATNQFQTFSFPIGQHALSIPDGKFFIGSSKAVSNNEYAVAVNQRNSSQFTGITPEKVRLNSSPDVQNPLYGAAIQHLSVLAGRAFVAKVGDPSSLYLIDTYSQPLSLYVASDIHDSQGNRAQSMLAITTSTESVTAELESGAALSAFAAIGNNDGTFDGNGSGIALLFFKRFIDKEKNRPLFVWDIVDAQTGASQFDNKGNRIAGGNKALAVGIDTPQLFINNPLTSITGAVDLHFDRDLGRLYIALDVVAGADPQDGARALLVASSINGRLFLQQIAPAAAFVDSTKIVGVRGALNHLKLSKVRTLVTTTHLRYVIVVGGANGNSSVYALPLVDNLKDEAHGTLAVSTSIPLTIFRENPPNRFLTRVYAQPAQTAADLFSDTAVQALVGGNQPLPGPITDITVAGDAIFVSVNNGTGQHAGIFQSTSLFDEYGRVSQWTSWQRVAGAILPIQGFSYDPYKGIFWYIPQDMQSGTVVLRTIFSTPADPSSEFFTNQLPQQIGGVQGLFDFPVSSPSFSQVISERLAVQVFTGFEKVLIMQTGIDSKGLFTPLRNVSSSFTTNDGTLKDFTQQTTLSISGGALAQCGALNSCALVQDAHYGWLVVGGSGGIAILADPQGHGWDATEGLQTHFKGLTSSMAFARISDVKNVRKLIGIGNNLFVLTNKLFLRLTINAVGVARQSVTAVTLAQIQDSAHTAHSYSDVIISGPLALLATSFGLLRSGDFVDVQTVSNASMTQWTPVPLYESAGSISTQGPISRLFALSPTGNENDIIHGGNVIAFNGYVGLSEAQVYRFVVNLQTAVNQKTVTQLPDLFIKGPPTFFVNLGDYRNYIVTDGALYAVSRSAFNKNKPILELLSPLLRSGQPQGGRSRISFLNISENSPDLCARTMGKMVRDSTSGSWIVPGDFGIRIQQ